MWRIQRLPYLLYHQVQSNASMFFFKVLDLAFLLQW